MMKEVGELELGDGLPEGKLRELGENGDLMIDASKGHDALATLIYRVQGQVTYKERGSPDQGVASLREGA
jgi:hypothetical protein